MGNQLSLFGIKSITKENIFIEEHDTHVVILQIETSESNMRIALYSDDKGSLKIKTKR